MSNKPETALDVLKAALQTLVNANDMRNSPIRDTIWHGDAETLFDYLEAAIGRLEGSPFFQQEWATAKAISELPDIDEAIRNLIEDGTEDNAVCLVREILRLAAPPIRTDIPKDWLRDGSLLYRLNQHGNNCDEINVTQAEGRYGPAYLESRADELLDLLNANPNEKEQNACAKTAG